MFLLELLTNTGGPEPEGTLLSPRKLTSTPRNTARYRFWCFRFVGEILITKCEYLNLQNNIEKWDLT